MRKGVGRGSRHLVMDLDFPTFVFVDDLLLFAKIDESNIEALVEVLDEFCKFTGLKINKEKSKIFFSPNITTEEKMEIVNQIGIYETHNLRK